MYHHRPRPLLHLESAGDARSKGRADFDVGHSFKAAVLHDQPRLRTANRLLRGLPNGWQVNSILTARTGFPFTPQYRQLRWSRSAQTRYASRLETRPETHRLQDRW